VLNAPSPWRAELVQLTAMDMSEQGWWASRSLGSLRTGWKVGSLPPRFATHKVRLLVSILTEAAIAGSSFEKEKKKIHEGTAQSPGLWPGIATSFCLLKFCKHSLVLQGYILFLWCLQTSRLGVSLDCL